MPAGWRGNCFACGSGGGGRFLDGRICYEVPSAEIALNPSNFSVACRVKTSATNSQIFLNMGGAAAAKRSAFPYALQIGAVPERVSAPGGAVVLLSE